MSEIRRPLAPSGGDPRHDPALARDRRVASLLPAALTVLALSGALLAVANALFLPAGAPQHLVALAAGATLAFLLARMGIARTGVPGGQAHLWATILGLFAIAVILYQLHFTGEPRDTGLLLLLFLGAGLVLLEWQWFVALASTGLAGWLMMAGQDLAEPEWAFFGLLALITASLSGVILHVRSRGVTSFTEHRREGRIRQMELETALGQTERARQGEEAARKALETALTQVKESEERFRRLADASFEGVLIYREGRILDANARAAEMFTVAAPQLLGDPVMNLVADPDRDYAEGFLLRGGQGSPGASLEVEGRRYDGSRFPMELSVVDSVLHGSPVRVLVIRDVTGQKRAEGILRRALEEAEANSMAKSTFLANMSHELRTPLNSVIGFANLLMKKQAGRAPDRELDFLRRIVSNGEHLLSLIEDILDLSKIDAQRMQVELEEIDLGDLVLEVVRSMEFQARRKGLYLEAEVDPVAGAPRIEADRRRLRQVLLNLTGNAIKFTSEGGVRVLVAEDDDAGAYRIDVEDTGIGIPPEQLDLVFQPFQQADPSHARAFGGTGLGLTISRSLCSLMGFELRVWSEVGRGSRFSIWMPRETRDDDVPETDAVAIKEPGSLSPAHAATQQENDA